MKNPYLELPDERFWKSAVATPIASGTKFSNLMPPVTQDKKRHYSSVGSCFAQHVGSWLTGENVVYLQSNIDKSLKTSFGLGNVYTPRTFLQWLEFALDETPTDLLNSDTFHVDDQGVWDLMRPHIAAPYSSLDHAQAARAEVAKEFVEHLQASDVLFFTLGLTESWKDQKDLHYPICPAAKHAVKQTYTFHNFTVAEIESDLERVIATLQKLNPALEVIFTVSPVPLTATATDAHVLVATWHSKSILRVAASTMTDKFPHVGYFPSFEIVNSPQPHDQRFETNLRTISKQKVEEVRDNFRHAFGIQSEQHKTLDAVCDEEVLSQPVSRLTAMARVSLIGDSHMGKLRTAFTARGIDAAGGAIMNGSAFAQHKFALCAEDYMVPLENAHGRRLWMNVVDNFEMQRQTEQLDTRVMFCNIGLQTHQNGYFYAKWFQERRKEGETISVQSLADFLVAKQSDQLNLLKRFNDDKHNLIVVSDPPFSKWFIDNKTLAAVIELYNSGMGRILQQLGINYFDAAEAFQSEGLAAEQYVAGAASEQAEFDWIHGNARYYDWLANSLIYKANQCFGVDLNSQV